MRGYAQWNCGAAVLIFTACQCRCHQSAGHEPHDELRCIRPRAAKPLLPRNYVNLTKSYYDKNYRGEHVVSTPSLPSWFLHDFVNVALKSKKTGMAKPCCTRGTLDVLQIFSYPWYERERNRILPIVGQAASRTGYMFSVLHPRYFPSHHVVADSLQHIGRDIQAPHCVLPISVDSPGHHGG